MKIKITKALHPIYAPLVAINAKSERTLDESGIIDPRLAIIDRNNTAYLNRIAKFEATIGYFKAELAAT